METFEVNIVELCRKKSKVVLDHILWGKQVFECECLQVINDAERLGVIIKGQEIYVYKKDIVYETDNQVSDGRLTITIINKL